MDCSKAPVQLLLNLGRIDDPLSHFSLVKRGLNTLLDVLTEARFYELTHFFAEDAMAVTHREEVSPHVFA